MRYLIVIVITILIAGCAKDAEAQEPTVAQHSVLEPGVAGIEPGVAGMQIVKRVRWIQRQEQFTVKKVKWVPTIVDEVQTRTVTEPVVEEVEVPVVQQRTIQCCPPVVQQRVVYDQPVVAQSNCCVSRSGYAAGQVGVISAPRVIRQGPMGRTVQRNDNFMYQAGPGEEVGVINVDGFSGGVDRCAGNNMGRRRTPVLQRCFNRNGSGS